MCVCVVTFCAVIKQVCTVGVIAFLEFRTTIKNIWTVNECALEVAVVSRESGVVKEVCLNKFDLRGL